MYIVCSAGRNDVPMVQLKVKVSNSLKSLLARLKKQEAVETKKEVQETETDDRSDYQSRAVCLCLIWCVCVCV